MSERTPETSRSLLLFGAFYGGMVTLGGVLGAKQVVLFATPQVLAHAGLASFMRHAGLNIGPLAVEAGIFPFLTLVALSSAVAQLHGRRLADRLVRYAFIPLITTILLTLFVLALPTDPGMYPPAQSAFPVILGQSWRMMAAGIISYGISVRLNVAIFSRLTVQGRWAPACGALSAALSQIVDTLLFISISFYGVRPIAGLMAGQMLAKLVLSALLVPLIIAGAVRLGRRLDA